MCTFKQEEIQYIKTVIIQLGLNTFKILYIHIYLCTSNDAYWQFIRSRSKQHQWWVMWLLTSSTRNAISIFFFQAQGMWSYFLTRDEICAPAVELWSLNCWTPGKSLNFIFNVLWSIKENKADDPVLTQLKKMNLKGAFSISHLAAFFTFFFFHNSGSFSYGNIF